MGKSSLINYLFFEIDFDFICKVGLGPSNITGDQRVGSGRVGERTRARSIRNNLFKETKLRLKINQFIEFNTTFSVSHHTRLVYTRLRTRLASGFKDSMAPASPARSTPKILLPLLFLFDFSSTDATVSSSSDNSDGQLSSKCLNPSDCITATTNIHVILSKSIILHVHYHVKINVRE